MMNASIHQIPVKKWIPPLTISERVAYYLATVKYCKACLGPIHPLARKKHFCFDCARAIQ